MSEYPLNQSSWGRAKQDAISAFHTVRFWVAEMMYSVACAIAMFFFIPSTASDIIRTVLPVATFAIGMLAVLGGVFLLSLVLAPYKQRNEARALLLAKPKPVALSNRTELIKSINQLKEIAKEYMWEQGQLDQIQSGYTVNTIAQEEVDKAYENYQEADKHIEEESLVAGIPFEPCISSFRNKVKLHVWIRYYRHEKQPDWTQVLTELDDATKECIKTIDDISQ